MILNWGIAAAGRITHDFVTAIKTIPCNKHKIIAIADPDLKRAQKFAELHNIEDFYDDFEKLAKNSSIDIIYVGTLNPYHFRVTKLMLEYGKNVLCEKPICLNYNDTKILYNLAKMKNVFLMEAMWSRFFPSYRYLISIIERNLIGPIKEIHVTHGFKANGIERIENRHLGGGITLDIGLYTIQLAQLLFKEYPNKIVATGKLNDDGIDVESEIILEYNKNHGKLFAKISALENLDNRAIIIGEKGRILLENYWCCTSLIDIDGTVKDWPLPNAKHEFNHTNACGLRYEAEEVRTCLKKSLKECPLYTHANSLEMVQIEDEIRRQLGVKYD